MNNTEFDIVYCRSCGAEDFCDCDEQHQEEYHQEEYTYPSNLEAKEFEYDGCEG